MSSTTHGTTLQPTYIGYVATAKDALTLFEACLRGGLNPTPRRPHDRERSSLIRSGSIFIYSEHQSSIKRWTDGIHWSPSRILGNFLVYRELDEPFPPGEKKRARKRKNRAARTSDPYTPSQRRSSHDDDDYPPAPSRSRSESNAEVGAEEKSLIGSLVDSYGFKKGGLVKRTMSICVAGITYHLVSYYTVEDVMAGRLRSPSKDESFDNVEPRADLTQRQNFRAPIDQFDGVIPDQQIGPGMGGASYGGYAYNPYRSNHMMGPGAHHAPPPPPQQQSPQHHQHGAHHTTHHNLSSLAVYPGGSYTHTAAPTPTNYSTVPPPISIPVTSSNYTYPGITALPHPPLSHAPLSHPPQWSGFETSAHQTVTLPSDTNQQTPPQPSYQYSRHNWPPPLSTQQSLPSRVGSIDAVTPASDGKSSEPDWNRHSHTGGSYSTLASPLSAQSAYGPSSTPWSAPSLATRDDWPGYRTGQIKNEMHMATQSGPEPSPWRQGVPCT